LFGLKGEFPPMCLELKFDRMGLKGFKQPYRGKDIGRLINQDGISALIVAKSGPLQRSLEAVLIRIDQINGVKQTDDLASTLRALPEHNPKLVLVDTSFSTYGALVLVKLIKAQQPGCRCLVLVDDVQDRQEAEEAGADLALVKGLPAEKLFEGIERLLADLY
jgi:DNA-binding NarL/FixJ family response regulator